ncbi:hypothetical protein [Enterobacter wuhouensis]|uniref:Uncharacterized protein n=1 Tax=Enterobacter wuhouensis TaxID=2529381 RepID=A0A4R0GCF2_9ENTR|nr:hypothetical protein [Enterobacter wuhouensis]TCB94566.1 hypothetical protein E0L20_00355 [Enterobacter wuhouensis]
MKLNKISKPDEERGWSFDQAKVRTDLFHLLSIFLAEKQLADELTGTDDPLWILASLGEPETTRLLISTAIVGRVLDDKRRREEHREEITVGKLLMNDAVTNLSMREAFNKIIHAVEFSLFMSEPNERGFCYLAPMIEVSGTLGRNQWSAEIDIIEYVRQFQRVFLSE